LTDAIYVVHAVNILAPKILRWRTRSDWGA
jgi:hypothetical protein